MMKSYFTYIFTLIIILSTTNSASDYTIDEYIEDVTKKHVQKELLSSEISKSEANYNQALGITDWSLETGFQNQSTDILSTSSFSPDYIDSNGAFFSISRPVLQTGGSLAISHRYLRTSQPSVEFNGISFNTPLFYENRLGFQYKQPLLFNFGGTAYKLPIMHAEAQKEQTVLNSNDSFEHFLLKELYAYVDWTLSNELTELSFSRLQLAKESLNQTKERVKVNLSEKIDLLRAQYAFQSAYQNWQSLQAQLKSTQFKFATSFDDNSLKQKTPKFDLYEPRYIIKPTYIVFNNLRSVQSMDLNEPVLKQQLELSQSKRFGTLNLVGTYEFISGDERFTPSFDFSNNNAIIAIEYQRDLSDTQTINDVKKNEESVHQFELKRKQMIQDLKSEVISLHTLIIEYQLILDTNLAQIQVSQDKAIAEEKLYKQGRSSIDMVIEAQDNVLFSKTNYAQLSADYQKYVLTYLALTDNLLKQYNVSL